jgi:integrase
MNCIKCKAELPEGAAFCHICGKKQNAERKGRLRGNGTGSVYKVGKTWAASIVLGYQVGNDGKSKAVRRKKQGFRTKKEALEYLPELRQNRTRKTPTLLDLWNQYRAGKYMKLSDSQQETYDIAWRKLEGIQFYNIDQLTTADLQEIVNARATTFYPARDMKSLLSKLYQIAMADQFINSNLSEFIVLPDLDAKEREAFTESEITALWEDYAAGNWWTGYVLLMCYTGMMPGELLAAKKDQIDREGQKIIGAGKKTKTRKETPIVLADIILPVLDDLCEHTDGDKLIRINKDRFYKVYYETLERAGVRRLAPYSCRHTAATALALENIPLSVVQKIMRHAKVTTTQQYIHIDVDPMLAAVNQMAKQRKERQNKTNCE